MRVIGTHRKAFPPRLALASTGAGRAPFEETPNRQLHWFASFGSRSGCVEKWGYDRREPGGGTDVVVC